MAFQPPRLGPGAIYLRSLDGLFRSNADLIPVAEIEPQTLSTKPTAPGSVPRSSPAERRMLASYPQRFLTHGVGYPIGGLVCDHHLHIEEFRKWNEELSCPWTSEHLSILHIEGANGPATCGFLMPPLQTDAQVELAAGNIKNRAAALQKPFAFETGVNYFAPRAFEMHDGDFFAAIAEAADSGIILDLTNLWVNHKNGRADIHEVLEKLPLHRVWEMHLAGIEFAHGHWLDAHSGALDPDLISIARETIARLPSLGAIIFEVAPDRVASFGEAAFLRQLETLHSLWKPSPTPSPEQWERFLTDPQHRGLELRPEDQRSFTLYSILTNSFRAGAIAELLENTTRLLLLALGEPELRALVDRYLAATTPGTFPTDEVLNFRRYLEANPLPVPGLKDLLNFEATLIESAADNRTVRITLTKDIDAVLKDIAESRLPDASSDRPAAVLEIGVDPLPFIRVPEFSTAK